MKYLWLSLLFNLSKRIWFKGFSSTTRFFSGLINWYLLIFPFSAYFSANIMKGNTIRKLHAILCKQVVVVFFLINQWTWCEKQICHIIIAVFSYFWWCNGNGSIIYFARLGWTVLTEGKRFSALSNIIMLVFPWMLGHSFVSTLRNRHLCPHLWWTGLIYYDIVSQATNGAWRDFFKPILK